MLTLQSMRRALYRQKFRQNTNAMRFSTESQSTQNTTSKEANAAKNTSEITFSKGVAAVWAGLTGVVVIDNKIGLENFMIGGLFFGALAKWPKTTSCLVLGSIAMEACRPNEKQENGHRHPKR